MTLLVGQRPGRKQSGRLEIKESVDSWEWAQDMQIIVFHLHVLMSTRE